ncbi:glycine C-acetyltransferase [Sphaerochaeta halotolerans]|jgi:glycine C-acetyltransferase|uniref:2-amino-3-ketobutyrate coenzyme A ligase n=1 Tax=Sphaerochaeta halotolerans TaxID=2293840 RepID=A0A372MLA3_9SPIR|nr:glycine C-acetyltransferase [Sphaerochaeta halotolerans]MBG0766467.1 glycine C-acetyltransferase [Spirochaetaceae bacterium]MDK2860531.1 glycine C-acetyltransferase [Sphaerochaeta sp.]MDN5333081.1 glycine C-acetyltransferase [Sphaerochaeta sp.]MXI85416.1 glycine C-acetyltransferase [Sphaerochaeta halotolerans]RFU95960.1 glycine C-acetyltransferase [Sphaerochaeta halotolerans]
MTESLEKDLKAFFEEQEQSGLMKKERVLQGRQQRSIAVAGGEVLNFCANNYLGLADNEEVIKAAKDAMDRWGYGLSSVRFICGTQQIHKELEKRVSAFLRTDDTILFTSCFDANGALFEPLLGEADAVISDELNHASIIDGIRLCKAKRYRYKHSDMASLEEVLQESKAQRRRLIATDGVFSMDGDIAKLAEICSLAQQYDALVMVDDSHATGYLGPHGRGTVELCGVEGKVDLITTTFGKACGGASGGCISGRQLLIDLYRQRARPYLFSNTLAPAICGGTIRVLDLLEAGNPYKEVTMRNARYFRQKMEEAGFDLVKGETAIVPVMIYDEAKAVQMADLLLEKGIYVIGFCYPVVPKGKARIRVQLSATHTLEDLDKAVEAFKQTAKEMDLL